jgi:L-phenylalanine/L-methionine N-acetyltransferase
VNRPPGGGAAPEAPPPPGVEIRPGRPADARGLRSHIATVAGERRYIRMEDEIWSVGQVRRRLRRSWTSERAELVAVVEGRIIGSLSIARDDGAITRHVSSLGMSVDREWRGQGVGSALLAEAFRWARWAGVEKVTLTVYPENERALALYRKFGFSEEGRLTGHSKKSYGYEDEIIMGRWL